MESVVFHSTEAQFGFPDLLSCRKRQTNMGKIQRTSRRTKANADKIKHIGASTMAVFNTVFVLLIEIAPNIYHSLRHVREGVLLLNSYS